MMDTIDCINSRRSIRKFLDIPVEFEKVGNILNAARFAPSSGNVQDWKLIILTEEDARQELGQACVEQYWVGSAPVIIVVCTDPDKAKSFYGEEGSKFTIMNASAAIENMLLAAHSQGLGSCWVGAFETERVKRLLEIPDNVSIHGIIPIGYPDEDVPPPRKYDLVDITFMGTWGNKIEDIAAYMEWYGEHIQKAAKKAKKLVKDFARRLQQ